MITQIIDGRAEASKIRASVAEEIKRGHIRPGVGVVLVGGDPASHLYVALKERACAEVGLFFERRLFPAEASQAEVTQAIQTFNERDDIDAILVQLPLPPHLDTDAIVRIMDPQKDVDGFHPDNLRAYLESGQNMPCLIEVLSALLDVAHAPQHGLACVLANSAVFSVPAETMLSRRGLEPTEDTNAADVIVTAVGKPGSLTAGMIKPGAIVLDVGTTRVGDKTVGDAADDLVGVAGALTPVPGGVGPMTVAMLLKKALEMAKRRRGTSTRV